MGTVPGADFDPTATVFNGRIKATTNYKKAKKELRTTRKERRQILGKEEQKQCCYSPITRSKAIERKSNFTENGLSGTTKQSFISYGHRSERKTRQTFVGDKKVNRKIEEVSNCFTLKY